MKRLTITIFLVLLAAVFSGCEQETRTLYLPTGAFYYSSTGIQTKKVIYEYDENDFLKAVKTYTYNTSGEETLNDTDTVTCDKDGNIIEFVDNLGETESLFASNFLSETTYQYRYDDTGKIVEKTASFNRINSSFQITITEQWSYNDQGLLCTYITETSSGSVCQSDFFYDEQGNLTTVRNYLGGEFASMTVCDCNAAGKIAEYRTFMADGKLYEHYAYTYDGNTVIEHPETAASGIFSSSVVSGKIYTYDEAGNLISETNSSTGAKITYTYRAIAVPADSPKYETNPNKMGELPVPAVYYTNSFVPLYLIPKS